MAGSGIGQGKGPLQYIYIVEATSDPVFSLEDDATLPVVIRVLCLVLVAVITPHTH